MESKSPPRCKWSSLAGNCWKNILSFSTFYGALQAEKVCRTLKLQLQSRHAWNLKDWRVKANDIFAHVPPHRFVLAWHRWEDLGKPKLRTLEHSGDYMPIGASEMCRSVTGVLTFTGYHYDGQSLLSCIGDELQQLQLLWCHVTRLNVPNTYKPRGSLHHLVFVGTTFKDVERLQADLSMDSLESLKITDTAVDACFFNVSRLTGPALKQLVLRRIHAVVGTHISHIVHFGILATSLERVEISNSELTAEDFYMLFEYGGLEQLKELILTNNACIFNPKETGDLSAFIYALCTMYPALAYVDLRGSLKMDQFWAAVPDLMKRLFSCEASFQLKDVVSMRLKFQVSPGIDPKPRAYLVYNTTIAVYCE